jgi:hypothetical protein
MTRTALLLAALLLPASLPAQIKWSAVGDGYANSRGQVRLNLLQGGITAQHGNLSARLSAGNGEILRVLASGEPDNAMRFIPEAVLQWDYAPARGGSLEIGKYYTNAAPDTAESLTGWNYTKSNLFLYATPHYHFGARWMAPRTGRWQAGAQALNGWNNVLHYKDAWMGGATLNYQSKPFDWFGTYYGGHQGAPDGLHERHLFDQYIYLRPHPQWTFWIEGDLAWDRAPSGQLYDWSTAMVVLRWAPMTKLRIAPRWEILCDNQGFLTGKPRDLQEVTLTAEYRLTRWLWPRAEFRRDWSAREPARNVFVLGLVAFWGVEYQ